MQNVCPASLFHYFEKKKLNIVFTKTLLKLENLKMLLKIKKMIFNFCTFNELTLKRKKKQLASAWDFKYKNDSFVL